MEAVTKMNDSETIVFDVREQVDFMVSHIESAINTPLSKLSEDSDKLIKYKKAPVLLACESGTLSTSAAKILSKAGYEQLFVITGGMRAWEDDYKLPIKRDFKKKAKID
jgi:rhodanese-related sulfurtransferase